MSKSAHDRLERAFNCRVETTYACTEAGVMTRMCKCGHLHINSDWYIVEPVDSENRPVKPGELSDKTLVTAFSRRVMPIIRYELTDRIIYHDEPCPCGDSDPWVEVEGRTNDILDFVTDSGEICKVASMVLFDIIDVECGEEYKNYQLVLKDNNVILCRLISQKAGNEENVFHSIEKAVSGYLKQFDVSIKMELTDEAPKLDERTGKFRQIYQESKIFKNMPGRVQNYNTKG